ncbi:MAG: hypothetical protein HUU57_10905 [Bdellovibrio sp.]|nr:hypothetical protein [Bdellovibrio sp.]
MKFFFVAAFAFLTFTSPFSARASEGTKHIRYYRCGAGIIQRINLLTGESLKAVLDKEDCKLFYQAPVAEALESGIAAIERGPIVNGWGIWSGPVGAQALFVFNEEQIHHVVENLSWALAKDLNVSLYFMVYQSKYTRRGFPEIIYSHVLSDAPILLETSPE